MPTLRVIKDTKFKQSAKQAIVAGNESIDVKKDKSFDLSGAAVPATKQEDSTQTHWKVTLTNPLKGKVTWYVYKPDVEIK
jgi:hypothetical protein